MRTNLLPAYMVVTAIAAVLFASADLRAQSQPATTPSASSGQASQAAASPQAVNELVRKLGDDSYQVRQDAQKQLTEIGEPARAALTEAVNDKDPEVRHRAEMALNVIDKAAAAAASAAMAKNILWTLPLKGGVVGSPVMCEGLLCAVGADGKLHVIDPATGKETWTADTAGELCRPVGAGGLVIVADQTAGKTLYAIDVKNRKTVWTAKEWNSSPGEPVAADGVVFAGDTKLLALDAKDGKQKWQCEDSTQIAAKAVGDGLVCSYSANAVLQALSAADGKEQWKKPGRSCTSIGIGGGKVCVYAQGTLSCLDAKTGESSWDRRLPIMDRFAHGRIFIQGKAINMGRTPAPVIHDGVVWVAVSDTLMGFESDSGKDKQSYKLDMLSEGEKAEDSGNGMVVVGGGMQAQVQVQMVVNGKSVMSTQNQRGATSLSIEGGAAYVGAGDGMHAVDLKSGKQLWCLRTAGAVSGEPVIAGGVMYFGTSGSDEKAGLTALKMFSPQTAPTDKQGEAK